MLLTLIFDIEPEPNLQFFIRNRNRTIQIFWQFRTPGSVQFSTKIEQLCRTLEIMDTGSYLGGHQSRVASSANFF